MVYRILAETRKPVIAKLRELVGERLTYTFVPRCAYVIDGITVEKDRTIVTEEDADMDIINALISDGLIVSDGDSADTEETDEAEETIEDPETDIISGSISLPIKGHTGNSLRNLVFTAYARGSLLSKATGGHFGASQELVEKLKEMETPAVEAVIEAVRETSGLDGIELDREKVSFTGFPPFSETGEAEVFMQLVEVINRVAQEQKRIQPKEVSEENEKYAFRTWMVRIGMGGAKFKEARKRLLRDLSGNGAFRTDADREKWNQKMKARKEAGHEVSA